MVYKMANTRQLSIFLISTFFVAGSAQFCNDKNNTWPTPIRRYSKRPQANPYCQAGVIPFCPTGEAHNTMPLFHPDDKVEIYALKKPVWQFKFGDTLGKFNIMHDAIGIKNLNTGLNYTMEWYELFQLFNCTFPHMRDGDQITWCNQGATCIYDGIEDRLWKENGTLVKVATTTGDKYNQFAQWVLWDNDTGLYYETWTVKDPKDGQIWFMPFDCASWVLRAFEEMGHIGVEFNQSVKLNYTKIVLYSNTPECLGNASDIFDKGGVSYQWAKEVIEFYSHFKSHLPLTETIAEVIATLLEVLSHERFFLYYNSQYWFLPMSKPYVQLTYDLVPLPKNNTSLYYMRNLKRMP